MCARNYETTYPDNSCELLPCNDRASASQLVELFGCVPYSHGEAKSTTWSSTTTSILVPQTWRPRSWRNCTCWSNSIVVANRGTQLWKPGQQSLVQYQRRQTGLLLFVLDVDCQRDNNQDHPSLPSRLLLRIWDRFLPAIYFFKTTP